MKWINVKDRLPFVDYENKISSAVVLLKISKKHFITAWYRHIFTPDSKGKDEVDGIFYDLATGHIYSNIREWRPLPKSYEDFMRHRTDKEPPFSDLFLPLDVIENKLPLT